MLRSSSWRRASSSFLNFSTLFLSITLLQRFRERLCDSVPVLASSRKPKRNVPDSSESWDARLNSPPPSAARLQDYVSSNDLGMARTGHAQIERTTRFYRLTADRAQSRPGATLLSMTEASNMMLGTLIFFPFFGFSFVLYFLPSIIAMVRCKRDTVSIVLLNLFLGWTLIGWVVALVWAAKVDQPLPAR